jgi:hypothetical protein
MENKQSVFTTFKSHMTHQMQQWFTLPESLPAKMPTSQVSIFLQQSSERHYQVTLTFDAPPTLLTATGFVTPHGAQWLFTSDDRRLYRLFTPSQVYSLQRAASAPQLQEAD